MTITINMNDSLITSISQIQTFLKVDKDIRFKVPNKEDLYKWINNVLTKFRYLKLDKKDKGIIRNYIIKMTDISGSQLTRLIKKKKRTGIVFLSSTKRHAFPVKYSPIDIALLLKTDNVHKRLSAPATKSILQREYKIFNKLEYASICNISIPHIYNLRSKRQYISNSLTIEKTKPIQIPIGQRKKPNNMGIPGFLRIDTVHQGDLDKEKGVYHINIVDEITQWELIGCVEKISEYYLIPLLKCLIDQFPFNIINFHSDNGSEYINYVVSKLLNKLLINQTKSRPRHSNDNGLIEAKNGAVIRKYIGRNYIPQRLADSINDFYQDYLNIYLNYHRPCGYPTTITDNKGKQKKIYKYEDYMVPYEKLKSLDNANKHLKKNSSFEELDKIAYAMSDNDFANILQIEKQKLIKNFKHVPQELLVFQTIISCSYVD